MRSRWAKVGWVVGGVLIVAYTLLPIVWIASLSFKQGDDINNEKFLPSKWSLENYRTVFDTDLFTSALRNSIGISLIATVVSVVLATFAAYAIARLEFRGKKIVLSMALAIAMFPTVALVGPLFDMWRSLGLYDTWIGLIIPYMSFTLPLSIWTLSAFFREIPNTKSFQAKKNVRMAAVNTPGAASGTITLRKACHVVAPSTWAACSISQGICRKNAVKTQIDSGRVNDM